MDDLDPATALQSLSPQQDDMDPRAALAALPTLKQDPREALKSLIDLHVPTEDERKLRMATDYYSKNAEQTFGPGSPDYVAKRLPGIGVATSLADAYQLSGSLNRYKKGEHTDDDIYKIAQHQAKSQYEQEREKSFGSRALDIATHAPGLMAEFAAGAGPAKIVGGMVAGRLGGTVAARLAGFGAQTAVGTALTPSLYVEQAARQNVEQGRDPLDPRGLAPAYGLAAAQMATLAAAGKYAPKLLERYTGIAFKGEGLGQATGRTAIQAVSGPFAQAGTDILTSAVHLDTGYGTVKKLLNGKYGEALQDATLQAMQFATFHAAHEIVSGGKPPEENPIIKELQDTLKTQADNKATFEQAAAAVKEAMAKYEPTHQEAQGPTPGIDELASSKSTYHAPGIEQLNQPGVDELSGDRTPPPERPEVAKAADDIHVVFDKAGLTDREKHVLIEKVGGRTHEDVGTDSEIMLKGRTKPYSRERIRQIEEEALAKIKKATGKDFESIYKTVNKPDVESAQQDLKAVTKVDKDTKVAVEAESDKAGYTKDPEAKFQDAWTGRLERLKESDEYKQADPAGRKAMEDDWSAAYQRAYGMRQEWLGKLRALKQTPEWKEGRPDDRGRLLDTLAQQFDAETAKRRASDQTPVRPEDSGAVQPPAPSSAAPSSQETQGSQRLGAGANAGQPEASGNKLISPSIAPEEHADVVTQAKRSGRTTAQAEELIRQVETEVAEHLQEEIRAARSGGEAAQSPTGETEPSEPWNATTGGPPSAREQPGGNAVAGNANALFAARGSGGGAGGGAVAPNVVTPPQAAQTGAGILRHRNAERMRRADRDAAAMAEGAKYFEKHIEAQPKPVQIQRFLDFFGESEKGTPQNIPAEQQGYEKVYRDIKDGYTAALVARDLIQSTIDNHISHLWKDPANPNATPEEIAAKLHSRRPLAGRESFRKQRVLDYFEDGIAVGLEPIDLNPMKYAVKELDQYNKSIMGHDAFNETKDQGLNVYRGLGDRPPSGWRTLPDKLWRVLAPGEAKVKEFFDKQQMEGLEKFADNLGIRRDRTTGKMPIPGAMGVAYSTGDIVTKFGTPEEVLAHEIGHIIDHRYGMSNWLQDPLIAGELTNLADLRASGRVDPNYKAYLRSDPERMANLVAAYLHAPELLNRVAPNAMAHFESLIGAHNELLPLRDIKPSLELDSREQTQRLAGPILTGHYYMPNDVATLFENHMSPGLAGTRVAGVPLYDAFRGFGNQMSQFILGWSGFHAAGTSLNAQFSAIAEGMGMLSRGDFGEALKKVPESVLPLAAAVRGVKQGSSIRAEWDMPGTQSPDIQQMVQFLQEAGGRARGGSEHLGSQLESVRTALRRIGEGDKSQIPSALLRALPALNQLASKPTMDYLVPLTKLSVAADAIRYELSKNPGMDLNQRRETFGKIWDAMDDRFGLLTYDNLFLNRVVRDGLQASFLSFGWNLGDVRGLGGGIADTFKPSEWKYLSKGEGISRRTAFLASMMVGTAIYGALYQLAATGKGPEEMKDLFFPKTGRTRPDGTADRISFPTYMKDLAASVNRVGDSPLQIPMNLYHMGKGKISPALRLVGELLENEDWKGSAIANPNETWARQGKDQAMHILKSFVPISVDQLANPRDQNASLPQKLQGMVGITPAPARITNTAEEQRAKETNRKVVMTPLAKKIKGK